MPPLSPVLYFQRNLKRTLPVLGIIALAVLGVLVVGVLAASQLGDSKRDWLDPARIFAKVSPRRGTLDPNIAARLRAHPDVEHLVRVIPASIRGVTMMGSQSFPIMGLPEKELDGYLSATGMHVIEGRLPQGSRRELMLHTALMKSKGLVIGDTVGRDVDPDEWLPGQFQVVGRLDGPIQLGLVTAPALREFTGRAEQLQVFAKPGRMAALDPYLRSLSSEDVDITSISSAEETWVRETGNVTPVLFAINSITVFVLSLAVGLLNQIYFLQRIPEYGILLALGYRVRFLVWRTLAEALTLTVTGWLLGLGLSYGLGWALREWIFSPRGRTLAALTPDIVATTLPIPLLIAVFSLVTVIRRLVTMDPVSIVERRD